MKCTWSLRIADDEFRGAAADVEDAGDAAAERKSAAHAEMDEASLLDVVEHAYVDAAGRTNGGQKFFAIRRLAHGRRRDGANVARSGGARRLGEACDRGNAALYRFFTEMAPRERIAAPQPHHFAGLQQRARGTKTGVHFDDDEMDRIGSNVDRAEEHVGMPLLQRTRTSLAPAGKQNSMLCCAGYPFTDGGDTTFEIDASRVKYGSGSLREVGAEARALGMTRVMLVTDPLLAKLPYVETVAAALRDAGCDVALYAQTCVEPTDRSFGDAAAFARDGRFDGFVSVGGGSSIDTAKAANLYATYPADFDAYVNAPLGRGTAVPGSLQPHIACPTTSGTGAEVTGIAIFDYVAHRAKTGIASKRIRPTLGVIDPDVTATLPKMVVACSGRKYWPVRYEAVARYEAGRRMPTLAFR